MKTGKKPINILVCGLGWSGSGTVVGLLSEYKDVVQIPGGPIEIAPAGYKKYGEFDYFRNQGLIGDFLKGFDAFFKKGDAVSRLKKQGLMIKYKSAVNSIKILKGIGLGETYRSYREIVGIHRLLVNLIGHFETEKAVDTRLLLAREWLGRVIETCGAHNKHAVILDQPIHLGQHEGLWQKFYDPYKIIFVYRDPRDIIAEQERHSSLFRQQMNSNVVCLYGDTMQDAIDFNLDSLLARVKQVDKILENDTVGHSMIISFEDLVTNYDSSKEKIEKFVGLTPDDHVSPKKLFDPSWSVKNKDLYMQSTIDFKGETYEKLMDWYNKRQLG